MEPFADVEADDVEENGDAKESEAAGEQEEPALREVGVLGSADVSAHGSAGEEQAGKVEKCVDPVGPAGDEAVKFAEGFLGPDVEAAFVRKAGGEFDDDQCGGNEEKYGGENPERDGGGAVVRGGSDPARAEDGGDVEEEDIPEAHDAAELGFGVCWAADVGWAAEGRSRNWAREWGGGLHGLDQLCLPN